MKFTVECPRCGKASEIESEEYHPRVNCGDCLMAEVEVVEMKIVDRKLA